VEITISLSLPHNPIRMGNKKPVQDEVF